MQSFVCVCVSATEKISSSSLSLWPGCVGLAIWDGENALSWFTSQTTTVGLFFFLSSLLYTGIHRCPFAYYSGTSICNRWIASSCCIYWHGPMNGAVHIVTSLCWSRETGNREKQKIIMRSKTCPGRRSDATTNRVVAQQSFFVLFRGLGSGETKNSGQFFFCVCPCAFNFRWCWIVTVFLIERQILI